LFIEMAAAGTLLADLDGQSGGSDGDLVQKILSDMNIPTSGGQRVAPPPLPAQTPMYQQQMPSSTAHINMDSHIPTSHMIGNEHPSPADFAAAMNGNQASGMAMSGMSGMPGMPSMPGMGLSAMPGMPAMPGMSANQGQQPSKNLYGKILDELKIPFVVSILFFLFSLPPIRVLVSHYMPSFIKQTGDFNTLGLLAVSLLVGLTFWLLHRVIAPLLSL
jgi:hypothetical protein